HRHRGAHDGRVIFVEDALRPAKHDPVRGEPAGPEQDRNLGRVPARRPVEATDECRSPDEGEREKPGDLPRELGTGETQCTRAAADPTAAPWPPRRATLALARESEARPTAWTAWPPRAGGAILRIARIGVGLGISRILGPHAPALLRRWVAFARHG